MIPIVLFQNLPGVLNLFALILRWIRILRNRRIANERFVEFVQIMMNFFRIVMHWLNLMVLVMRWMNLIQKKNRRLFKPHLLIRLLGGYRFMNIYFQIHILLNWIYMLLCKYGHVIFTGLSTEQMTCGLYWKGIGLIFFG